MSMEPLILRSARYLVAEAQARILRPGDTAVDCTLGNGHDALSLAKRLYESRGFSERHQQSAYGRKPA